jgi:hypothetical protein
MFEENNPGESLAEASAVFTGEIVRAVPGATVTCDYALARYAGVSIGHTTLAGARTGCTVIRFDQSTLTAVDVRGAAPGTRELDLLAPGQAVQAVDAYC